MLGIAVLLLISWGLVYGLYRKNIFSIWLMPVSTRFFQFIIGGMVTAFLCLVLEYMEVSLTSAYWDLLDTATVPHVYNMVLWDVLSVFTEELMFRGVLLYLLIRWWGDKKALWLSAIAFGIYHWFTFGIMGNLVPMVVVFIGTALMGYALALAYAKTRSLIMPAGLHLGWNITHNVLFSKGPLGAGILVARGAQPISDWYSLVGLWLMPLILILIVRLWVPAYRGMEGIDMERGV